MAAKKKRRKVAPKRRRGSGQIPLAVLKRRQAKLSRVIKERESKRQMSMF